MESARSSMAREQELLLQQKLQQQQQHPLLSPRRWRRPRRHGCHRWLVRGVLGMAAAAAAAYAIMLVSNERSAAVAGGGCATALDCELNGSCDEVSGRCSCDPGWRGSRCERLALKPSGVQNGYRREHMATWGGNVVERRNVSEDGARFHLFAAEMLGGCGLKSWRSNSQIMHAVADAKEGPFTRRATALPAWAHNPQVVRAPDGTYLLFHIGSAAGSDLDECPARQGTTPHECQDGPAELLPAPPAAPSPRQQRGQAGGNRTFPLHFSHSLDGPWTPVTASIDFDVGSNANPSPLVLANGTVLILFNAMGMALAQADHWRGPYRLRTTGACGRGEDPFLYRDKRDHLHCLAHAAPFDHPASSIVHSFSLDGYSWHVSHTAAAGSRVAFDNGQTVLFSKRERPKLLFDANHDPSHLVSGLTLTPQCAPGFLYPGRSNRSVTDLPAACANQTLQYYLTNRNPCPGNYDLAFTHIQRLL